MSQEDFELIEGLDEGAHDKREIIFPRAQWFSGNSKLKGKKMFEALGGIIIPKKEWVKAIALPAWDKIEITFDSGESEQCVFSQASRFVVIRSRRVFCRVGQDGKETDYSTRWREGLKSKNQHLVIFEGCDQVFSLNIKSTTGGAFEAAISDHCTNVVNKANATAKQQLPPYAFWMNITPSGYTTVGKSNQSKTVTHPALTLPEDIDREWIKKQFVGASNVLRFQAVYKATQDWADAWKNLRNLAAQEDEWACGTGLKVQYEAMLAQMTGGDAELIQGYVEEALRMGDADAVEHLPASKMREVLQRWHDEHADAEAA